MRVAWIGILAVAAACAAPSDGWAGEPQERKGFWIGAALGGGTAAESCDGCEDGDREWGFAGDIRAGWALNRNVLVGTEIDFWMKEEDGVTLTLYDFLGAVTVYPASEKGFFLKAGVGGAFVDTQFREGNSTVNVDLGHGLALMGGAGHDVRVGRNWSITPSVTYWRGQSIDLELGNGEVLRDWSHNVIAASVGVTFH